MKGGISMTQREFLNTVIAVFDSMTDNVYEGIAPQGDNHLPVWSREEMLAMACNRLDALDKKNSSSSNKPTKKQLENEKLYLDLLDIMADGAAYTVRQITDAYNTKFNVDFSTNKIQPQITKAVKCGVLTRSVAKGVVYFTYPVTKTE